MRPPSERPARRVRTTVALATAVSAAVLGLQAGTAAAAPDGGRTTAATQSAAVGPSSLLAGEVFQNTEEVFIEDWGPTIITSIEVTGVSGNAPADLKVTVDIDHDARGDLVIDLIAPDGTVHPLKEAQPFDWEPYVGETYTVDASAESANGTWKLRVQDVWGCGGIACPHPGEGHLHGWSLSF